jgi:hypothetical protein
MAKKTVDNGLIKQGYLDFSKIIEKNKKEFDLNNQTQNEEKNDIAKITKEEHNLALDDALNELDKKKKTKEDIIIIENLDNYFNGDFKKHIEDIIKQQVEKKVEESINNTIKHLILPSKDNTDNNLDIAGRIADLYTENEDNEHKIRVQVKQGDKVISDSNSKEVTYTIKTKTITPNIQQMYVGNKLVFANDYDFSKIDIESNAFSDYIKNNKINQSYLSTCTGITRGTLFNIMKSPSTVTLLNAKKLAIALGVDIEVIFPTKHNE